MKLRHTSEVLTEISIVALTVIVAFGLERLFVDRSYLPDLLLLVTASHLLALMVRRAGFGMGVSALVSAAGMLVVGNLVLFPADGDAQAIDDFVRDSLVPAAKRAEGIVSVRVSDGPLMSPQGAPPYSKSVELTFESLAHMMAFGKARSEAERVRGVMSLGGLVLFYEVEVA